LETKQRIGKMKSGKKGGFWRLPCEREEERPRCHELCVSECFLLGFNFQVLLDSSSNMGGCLACHVQNVLDLLEG
jgi:hypothetical protein